MRGLGVIDISIRELFYNQYCVVLALPAQSAMPVAYLYDNCMSYVEADAPQQYIDLAKQALRVFAEINKIEYRDNVPMPVLDMENEQ